MDHDQETNRDVKQVIGLLKAMRELPEGKHVWTLWGEDIDARSLPLVGPGIRDANNGTCYSVRPSTLSYFESRSFLLRRAG
jgi:hypothetical protein